MGQMNSGELNLSKRISGWDALLDEGRKYLAICTGKSNKVFSGELSFSILGMALEKISMAYIFTCGDIPEHHSALALYDSMVGKGFPGSEKRRYIMKKIDSCMNICSLDDYSRSLPPHEELSEMISTVSSILHDVELLVKPF